MYGMVNDAIREYIIETYGDSEWQNVAKAANVDTREFGSIIHYDDGVTLAIIGGACSSLKIEPPDFLRSVGMHWVDYASRSPFASLMRFGGRSFESFVANLDTMHSKIKVSLPNLKPPSFLVTTSSENQIQVTYRSDREGLFPFVEGLFAGLSKFFDQPVEIMSFQAHSAGSGTWMLKVSPRRADHAAA